MPALARGVGAPACRPPAGRPGQAGRSTFQFVLVHGPPHKNMKLYNLDYCSYCMKVRRKLDDLGLSYEKINVPLAHHLRTEVIQVSGQPTVPVLIDGDVVLDHEDEIIEYLDTKYGKKQETR